MRFRVSSANHYTIGPRTLAAKGRGRFTLSGVPSDVEVCSSPTEHGGEFSLLRCPAWGVAPLFKTRDSTAYAGSLWSPRPSEGQTSEYAREGTEGTASHSTVAWSPLGSQTLATEPNTEQHPLHYKVSLVVKSDTFSICACHPCAGAMLIFSVSFQFLRMSPRRGLQK